MQQGGLTGTGRTHNRHGFAGVDIEAHVTQNRVIAVGLVQVAGRNDRTGREGRLLHLLGHLGCLSGVTRLALIIPRLALLTRLTLLSGILTGRLCRRSH